MPAEFFALVKTLWQALPTWNASAVMVSLLSLGLIIVAGSDEAQDVAAG